MKRWTSMRRSTILLVVTAMALAVGLPAEAKKPSPPAEPSIYTATISFESESGIATTCLDADQSPLILEMTRTDGDKGVSHFESGGARLDITGDLAWGDEQISGCHGELAPPEYFRITLEDDGTVAMLWIFDVETIERAITLKNGRTKTETVRTDFRMGGPYVDDDFTKAIGWDEREQGWEAADGSISFSVDGSFAFVQFDNGRDPLFLELTNWLQQYTLTITLTPA